MTVTIFTAMTAQGNTLVHTLVCAVRTPGEARVLCPTQPPSARGDVNVIALDLICTVIARLSAATGIGKHIAG